MANVTRRSFLWQTSVGAAAAGVVATAPSLFGRNDVPSVPVPQFSAAALSEPLVAYVRNAATGEVALLLGTREIIVRDAELVRRLLKAAG